jgi:hypothetical protein
VPEQRVVVEVDLGVEADEPAGLGHHQRVDFKQRHVLVEEGAIERLDQLHTLLDLIALELQGGGDLAAVEGRVARRRVDRQRGNLLGRVVRHLLDIHAAFRGGNQGNA